MLNYSERGCGRGMGGRGEMRKIDFWSGLEGMIKGILMVPAYIFIFLGIKIFLGDWRLGDWINWKIFI